MKSLKIFAAALAAFALLSITNVDAQSKKEGWQDKVKSEKIGFITVELNLTPEEAQVFWPVYNEIANRKAELQKQVRESYKALLKALNEEGTTDKEIDKLLDNYLAAKQAVKDNPGRIIFIMCKGNKEAVIVGWDGRDKALAEGWNFGPPDDK